MDRLSSAQKRDTIMTAIGCGLSDMMLIAYETGDPGVMKIRSPESDKVIATVTVQMESQENPDQGELF